MKGAYCLIIKVAENFEAKAGALGRVHFTPGYYTYIGSAMNSLEGRIGRHLKNRKKKHWHIDYLLAKKQAKIVSVFVKESEKRQECDIAKKVARIGKAVNGFGCSDCRCEAHLFKINRHELEKLLKKEGFEKWQ